jgi:hypothetical protein
MGFVFADYWQLLVMMVILCHTHSASFPTWQSFVDGFDILIKLRIARAANFTTWQLITRADIELIKVI